LVSTDRTIQFIHVKVRIANADSEHAIARCFPVIVQLRPHLGEAEFVSRVQRQQAGGYRLAYLEAESRVRAAAGYRFFECLAWGRICYVDDLVAGEDDRSQGFGGQLFDWLLEQARAADCEQFHLDSGVQRFAAHRFYLNKRLNITSHHFSMALSDVLGP